MATFQVDLRLVQVATVMIEAADLDSAWDIAENWSTDTIAEIGSPVGWTNDDGDVADIRTVACAADADEQDD